MKKQSKLIFFSLLVLFSCKDADQINLESTIDEFKYLKTNNLLTQDKINKLKSNFENLSFNNKHSINVTSLYYLSEISIIENKFEEANKFINKAYLVNHSDSIYKQIQRINSLMSAKDTSEITEKNAVHNDLLKIFEIGRNKIKDLYDKKDYQGAISQTYLLIEVIKNLKGEELVKTELSQLFQDLAIFYSQQNNIEKAKESIERAVSLNPNTENIEIQKLINSK